MTAASNYLENEVLDHVLGEGGRNYTSPTLHVALFSNSGGGAAAALESGTSSTSGTGNWGFYEINNGNYARQGVNFAAASSGSAASNSVVTFPQANANYQTAGTQGNTVTHIALMDGSTGGNVLFYGALSTSKTVTSGDTFQINSGSLTISLA
jgi:hypothetical protein